MAPVPGQAAIHGGESPWVRYALLWLVGVSQLLTLLAAPPVIPLIHRDLGLNETGIALLTDLPVLLFAAATVPGSLLIARVGACRALVIGLLLTGIASGLRGAGPSTPVLFGMTFFMGIGIAIFLPAIPSLISVWLSHSGWFGHGDLCQRPVGGRDLERLFDPAGRPPICRRSLGGVHSGACPRPSPDAHRPRRRASPIGGEVRDRVCVLVCGPLAKAIWDASHVPATLFLPILVGTLTVLAASFGVRAGGIRHHGPGAEGEHQIRV